ncbi:unnamed protein product [Ixodes persulcatus]
MKRSENPLHSSLLAHARHSQACLPDPGTPFVLPLCINYISPVLLSHREEKLQKEIRKLPNICTVGLHLGDDSKAPARQISTTSECLVAPDCFYIQTLPWFQN